VHIFLQAYLDHFTYEEQEQDWRDLIGAGMEDVLLVAEDEGGVVVGYALGRAGPARLAPYDGELVALHVRRSHQRQGVESALVAAKAEHLEARGCTALMLWVLEENGPARAFYERLGGRLVGTKTTHLGEGDIEEGEVGYGWTTIENLAQEMPGTG
jgi:ribosomal protein S18 acetylase RimI-like enzyme